ncbi:MAG: helix-turn-helix domain-containing protein [Actinobacteria bacterium]|nr:helix-turn-helix domain-containing protein [Actinomycetota bacterium]
MAAVPPGLIPPPSLDWDGWRRQVRQLKEERGLSINDLTMRSGLDRSTVIEILNGRRGVNDIRMTTLWALAWALQVEDVGAFIRPLFEPVMDADQAALSSRTGDPGLRGPVARL